MWHPGTPEDGILSVRIEREDASVNSLNRKALEELDDLIARIRKDTNVRGVLFHSGKPGTFIAGADVTELQHLTSAEAAAEISRYGQRVFSNLESLTVPTVALISGACLGGGLEFAMACNYRIADERGKTQLGLPEVKLGLIPGWGGTVRLPRLTGLTAALPLILTGRMLNGRQARSKGIVHDVVPPEALQDVGRQILQAEIARPGSAAEKFRPPHSPAWMRWSERTGAYRKLALNKAEKQTRAQTHGHYPAPLLAVEALRAGMLESPEAGFIAENEAVAQLSESPVTRELMRLFFISEEAKKPPAEMEETLPPESITRAAVIGAGAMGAGIALLMARKDIWTRLKDLKPEYVAAGIKTARKLISTDASRRKITQVQATQALDHLSPTTDYRGLKHADVVIEAVVEDLNIKRRVFAELADATSPETVLATNTSSLLVSDIAQSVPHPERVVGLHFFNPPHQMPLVEVIRTAQTSPAALAKAVALVQRLGKTMVVVGDCTGFLVNRLLAPYMNEAGYLLAEIRMPLELEAAAVDFGMPMGPLALTDLVGVDVAAHVAANMQAAYGERMASAPLWRYLKELHTEPGKSKPKLLTDDGKKMSGELRRAVGLLKKETRTNGSAPQSREEIQQRLIFPIINEAALCLAEGIAARPEDVDIAMVFGTGFAPFRGGPLRFAETYGLSKIVDVLERWAEYHPRLAPSAALKQMAAEGLHCFDASTAREPSSV